MAVKLKPADIQRFARRFAVEPGTKVKLKKDFDPGNTEGYKKPENATEILEAGVELLATYQDKLYGEGSRGLLIVLQALDAAGKDGTIKHVMSGVNPQGCQVTSFKSPSSVDLSHDYLWRCIQALPQRGHIGIFNRSYYEETLVVRVHPEILGGQQLPTPLVTPDIWHERFEDIVNYEKYLSRQGVVIRKFFLHLSKDEQRRRFLERLEAPDKHWKFSLGDLTEREYFAQYQAAYEDMIRHTATPHAPWYVVPADHKWFTRLVVASAVIEAIESVQPSFPTVDAGMLRKLKAAETRLRREAGQPSRRSR